MRSFSILLMFLPFQVLADDIALSGDVTAVTLYPQGAAILREVPYSMPAGQHRLVLRDLPRSTPLEQVRVEVSGAVMGGVTTRRDDVPPRAGGARPDIAAARDEVERREAALRAARAQVEIIELEAEAAQARVRFLERLGDGEGVARMDVAALRALSAMIGEETLSALQQAQAARHRAEEAALGLKDLEEALARARQALAALETEDKDRAVLSVDVSSDMATEGILRVSYVTDAAGWTPVYDLSLTRATGVLDVVRGAFVAQSTGEDWRDVTVTLSTQRPTGQSAPGVLYPLGLRIYEENQQPSPLTLQKRADMGLADAAPEAPIMEEGLAMQAAAQFDGIAVTYSYPGTVSVASGADRVRLALGTLETQAEIVAKAVPLKDTTAFLMAGFSNDMGELILPTQEASFYLDGRFVGQRYLDLIAAGDEAELSFGPIDGLRLTRTVEDREEGDRGVISKSNEINEAVSIEVENLTAQAWSMRVLDRVPYSEQEDLEITWQASPRPTEERVDGKRGVMAWDFELAAGETETIHLSHTIEWPDGMQLR